MKHSTDTRQRLLRKSAKIFSKKGYHQATTREICIAAETNITSIHYYFKDKAGLYKAIFSEPFKDIPLPTFEDEKFFLNENLHEALVYFYSILLAPFMNSNPIRDHKLHRYLHELVKREQFEPTGLVDDLLVGPAKYIHEPLNLFLCQRLGIKEVDNELHRLSFAIVGLGFSLVHPRHIVSYFAADLLQGPDWEQTMFARLADFAVSIIEAECKKR